MRTHPALRGIGGLRGGVLIGRGGFSVVYRATQTRFDRTVAVKLLTETLDDEQSRLQFTAECKAFGALGGHPHVLSVYDAGLTADGIPYLLLEHCARGSLAQRIARAGPRPPVELRVIVHQTAEALAGAHAAHVLHRDVKPGNILVDDFGRCRLSDFGIATVRQVVAGGQGLTPGFAAPEVLSGDAAGAAADVYALAITACVAAGADARDPEPLQALTGVDDELVAVLRGCLATDPAARPTASALAASIGDVDRSLDRLAGEPFSGLISSDETLPTGDDEATCPYRGLARYGVDDGALFFGRDALIDRIADLLRSHRLVAVVGPSGSGKSSVVRAGLVNRASIASGATCTIVVPGSRPTDVLPRDARPSEDGPPQLLVVDQFEEVFTQVDRPERARFVSGLIALSRTPRWQVVLVLRSDFYGRCAEHPVLSQRVSQAHVLVGAMGPHELTEAIQAPAEQQGLTVEPELVGELVDAAMRGAGTLPLVSHALAETWARRRGDRLTLAAYREAGGIDGAVAETAERVYEGLDEPGRASLRRLLVRLATPVEGTFVSRPTPLRELRSVDDPSVRAAVDALSDERLVVVDDDTVEVTHEALFEAWPTLHEWLVEDRDAVAAMAELGQAAARWLDRDRDPSELWRGAKLARVLEAVATRPDYLTDAESDFLAAATDERDAANREARHRNERMEATNRRLRRLLAVAVVAILAASVTGVAFLVQRDATGTETERAARASRRAAAQSLADSAEGLIDDDLPLARLLAAQAVSLDAGSDRRGVLSMALSGDLPADAVVQQTREEIPTADRQVPMADGSVVSWTADRRRSIMWSADGEQRAGPEGRLLSGVAREGALIVDRGDAVVSWTPADGTQTEIAPTGVDSAAWSAGDPRVALRRDGALEVRDIDAGPEADPVAEIPISGPAAPPESSGAFLGRGQGWTAVWTGEEVRIVADDGAEIGPLRPTSASTAGGPEMAVSPDGDAVVVTRSDSPTFDLWSVAGERITQLDEGQAWEGSEGPITFVDRDRLARWNRQQGSAEVFDTAINVALAGAETGLLPSAGEAPGPVSLAAGASGRFVAAVGPSPEGGAAVLGSWAVLLTGLPHRTLATSGMSAAITRGVLAASEPGGLHVEGASPATSEVARVAVEGAPPLATLPPVGRVAPEAWSAPMATTVALSAEGTIAAAAFPDGHIEVWDLDVERSIYTHDPSAPGPGGRPNLPSVAVSPDGGQVAYIDEHLTIAQLPEDPSPASYGAEATGAGRLEYAADGTLVATAGQNLRVVDATGSDASSEPLPDAPYHALALTPDGSRAYVGGAGGAKGEEIQMFDLASLRRVGPPLRAHDEPVTALAIDPDGTYLASADTTGTIRIWPLDGRGAVTGAGYELTRDDPYLIWDLDVTASGSLVVGRTDGTLTEITMDVGAWVDEACRLAGRSITEAEWERWGSPDVVFEPAC